MKSNRRIRHHLERAGPSRALSSDCFHRLHFAENRALESGTIVSMFDLYSERARQVIFLTRLESGARGAEMIGVDDLFAALIVEDQNKISDALSQRGETGTFIGLTTHQPFLPPDAATSLLENIRRSLPRSQSIPTSADMAISPALGETLAAASDLKEKQ